MTRWMARACFRAARTFTSRFPTARGVSRVMNLTERRIVPALPERDRLTVRCDDGRAFDVSVHDPAAFNLMMLGGRDPLESAWVRRLVRPGDVMFDIGANFGWYTTLGAKLVAPNGRVHAFEPVSGTYKVLKENCTANDCLAVATLNNFGLGESEGAFTIFVPKQHGGASLRPSGIGPMDEIQCRVGTLDSYCQEQRISAVRFAKCDVEGAELGVLRGAQRLLSGDSRPIWLLELNRETSSRFGHEPQALLSHLAKFEYSFHRIVDATPAGLKPVRDSSEVPDGDNVICSVPRIHGHLS